MEKILDSIERYEHLFRGCLIFGAVFTVITIGLFVMWDIPTAVGYLTGISAKKRIRAMKKVQQKDKEKRRRKETKDEGTGAV